MKRVLLYASGVSVVFGALLHIQGCGKSSGSSVGDTAVGLKVGSIATAVSMRSVSRAFPTDAAQSNNEFAYAKVDGIKLNLRTIDVVQSGGSPRSLVDFGTGKEVIIAPGSVNNVPITQSATINSGSYDSIRIRYDNAYKIKAYCRTNTKLVYTTAAGIQTMAVGSAGATVPASYDYYAYPFAEITTAKSATGGNGDAQTQTDGTYTITKGSSVDMAVLFDPSYLVTCFDGTTPLSGSGNKLNPFGWTNNNGVAISAFFPDSAPNFGMGYVPIFIWVSQTAGEALPTAETYASSTNAGNVTGTINYKNVNITSFAFRADGSVLAARARISGGGGGEFNQFFSDYTKTANTYSMKNGEWQCKTANYTGCGFVKDRAVTGFTRTTTSSTSTLDNGPDCGTTCTDLNHPEWGNRCRACLGAPQTMTWVPLPR